MVDAFIVREALTLQAMADRCGLSVATVAALRSGMRGKRPQPHTLRKLAAAMGCEVSELEAALDGATSSRRREQALISRFRLLSEDKKSEVERLVGRLHAAAPIPHQD